MLSVYTNQKELLKASSTSKVSRLESVDKALLDVRNYSVTLKSSSLPNLELHVYTPDGVYLTGNHKAIYSIESNDTTSNLIAYQHVGIDAVKELETLGITRGQYRLVYNFVDNILGSYESQKAWIKEISPSRRELRIQLADNSNTELLRQLFELRDRWEELSTNDIFDSFVLNFGFNETYQIINFRFDIDFTDTPEVIVKLYNPLPAKYGEKSKVWISEEIINPILDVVSIIPKHIPDPVNTLAGPNFELESEEGGSVATDFKSWNDLLSTNVSTSQQLIDSQFSGSLAGIKLNINYRLFDNFVHYGSAVERVKNFKYKLELIEYYTNQSETLSQVIGGTIVNNNISDVYFKRNAVVSGFDDFEKYLFFESTGSRLYTHYDSGTGSIDPWPKKAATAFTWLDAYTLWSTYSSNWTEAGDPDPYEYFKIQEATNSVNGETYYADLLEKAEIYDRFNTHKLQNTIPLHIQDSDDSDEFLLFVNMLGQHFDILWTYVNSLSSIHTREEHPKDGMSEDLLYQVASSLGINLLNGRSSSELWKYSLGVDENGIALQDGTNGITSISDASNTKEIWRRIVNNLPYILKTKGTSRSVKALLSCFGIPASVLTIKEYGGPSTFTDNDHYPEYVHDVYHYAWNSQTGSLELPLASYKNSLNNYVAPNTLEFRFKTDNNNLYQLGSYYNVMSDSLYGTLYLEKDAADDQEGTLRYSSYTNLITIPNLQIFDDSWHTVAISEEINQANSYSLVNVNDIYTNNGSGLLGGGSVYIYDEITTQPKAYWSGSLQEPVSINQPFSGGQVKFNKDGNIENKLQPGIASIWDNVNSLLGYIYITSVTDSTPTITVNYIEPASNWDGAAVAYISDNVNNVWKGNLVEAVINQVSQPGSIGPAIITTLQVNGESLFLKSLDLTGNPTPFGINFPIFRTNNLTSNSSFCYTYGLLDWDGNITSYAGYDTITYDTTLKVAKSLYGNTIYIKSGSHSTSTVTSILNRNLISDPYGYNANVLNFGTASSARTIYGLGGTALSKFNGHYHEIRLWSGSLNDNSLAEHAASPATYTYNSDRATLTAGSEASKPYDHLLQRFTLANKSILSGSLYQPSVHPNQTVNTGSLYFIGFANSGSIAFEGFEETYYTPSPSLGGSSLYTNKVRIESASLDPNVRLNTKTRVEKSSFDRYSIDSNRLGIYFSPQTAINEDIFNQLGYFEIDDYIGNPNDTYNDTYRDLNNFAISYWKKYENRNDFEAYFRALEIYDFTMFKYIKKLLLPQRSNAIVGLVVEPNVLERSKVKLLNKPVIENLTKEANIEPVELILSSEYQSLKGIVDAMTNELSVDVDPIKIGEIKAANEITLSSEYEYYPSTIEGAINVDRLGDAWTQNRYIGKYKVVESGSYNVLQTTVYNSRLSNHLLTVDEYFYSSSVSASLNKFYSSSLKYAEVNNFYGTGNENAKWFGSKLTGAGVNINSANTVDGGPVVKITKVNPNTIVFANNQVTTVNKSISGTKTKSI
jgi:hypothetical protein